MTLVIATGFNEHPEGYKPRLFATTGSQVFEILKNGCVVEQPSLPPQTSKFDWWYIKIQDWHSLTFSREPFVRPTVPQEVLDGLIAAGVDIKTLEQ